jgi:hypothetical protein
MIAYTTVSILLLLLLPLLTFVPNFGFSIHESNLASDSNTFDTPDTNISNTLTEIEQRNQQERVNRFLVQGQQNWSTYEDPILGIQFEHPSWWRERPGEDLIKFYHLPDPDNELRMLNYDVFTNVHYFLPPLSEEMNTLDKFMRQMMSELRSDSTQNISVNRTATIGVDDIPAYRVEYEDIFEDIVDPLHFKTIRYFSIDNRTGTGYMISLHTEMERLQEDVPLFERLVESFKILA